MSIQIIIKQGVYNDVHKAMLYLNSMNFENTQVLSILRYQSPNQVPPLYLIACVAHVFINLHLMHFFYQSTKTHSPRLKRERERERWKGTDATGGRGWRGIKIGSKNSTFSAKRVSLSCGSKNLPFCFRRKNLTIVSCRDSFERVQNSFLYQ